MNKKNQDSDAYKKGELIYEGKAKRLYSVIGNDDLVFMEYKNSLTAFNAQKKGEFPGKGKINQEISNLIFGHLAVAGIEHHLVELIDSNLSLVKKLKMIPLEVVVRNKVAGSLAKKFQIEEGQALAQPLLEYYYKDDAMGDPFITEQQAVALGFMPQDFEFSKLARLAFKINEIMKSVLAKIQIDLIDFKLEFGIDAKAKIVLADEISPDSCRLWDMHTQEKLDKDRFRRDLGRVQESYEEILSRLRSLK